mgnify:CR=1 FL=1
MTFHPHNLLGLHMNRFSPVTRHSSTTFNRLTIALGTYNGLSAYRTRRDPGTHTGAFSVPPIVFLAVGPLPNDPDVYVGQVVNDLNAQGNKRVHFINMKGTLTDPSHDYGCDGHPSVSGDIKMASKVDLSIIMKKKKV